MQRYVPDTKKGGNQAEKVANASKLGWSPFVKKHLVLVVILSCMLLYLTMRVASKEIDKRSTAPHPTSLAVAAKCLTARASLGLDGIEDACPPEVKRALLYCNEKIVAGSEGSGKGKGLAVAGTEYELEQLSVLIRHGDRTAIHVMPGGSTLQYAPAAGAGVDYASGSTGGGESQGTNGLQHPVHGNKYLDVRALDFAPHLLSFAAHPLSGDTAAEGLQAELSASAAAAAQEGAGAGAGAGEASKYGKVHREHPPSHPIPDALNSQTAFSIGDTELPPGRLTTRGFMQHVTLGRALHQAYSAFLAAHVPSAEHLRVRSTNYQRTILSAAAFLIGLVPDIGGPQHPIQIGVFETDAQESMHGVAAHCAAAAAGAKSEKQAFSLDSGLEARLERVFGTGVETSPLVHPGAVRSTFVTDMADVALARLCHNQELPCSAAEHGSGAMCMTESDLGDLVVQADRAFCSRYTGEAGGLSSTKLNVYPFLREVIAGLTDGDGGKGAASPPPRLSLFSGHDTVIAPVLEGLGIYRRRCDWPPYASRLVFELWRRRTAPGQEAAAGDAAAPRFVRVLFNGEDLTRDVPACGGAAPCPLEAMRAQVESLLAPHEALREACSA